MSLKVYILWLSKNTFILYILSIIVLSNREKILFAIAYYQGTADNFAGSRGFDQEWAHAHAINCANDVLDELGLKIETPILKEIVEYNKEMDEITHFLCKEAIENARRA